MASISFDIDVDGLTEHLEDYYNEIVQALSEAWGGIADACIANIMERVPDPATELNYIMYGEGGVPVSSSTTLRTEGDRIRFIRSPGMWLQDAIPLANMVDADTFTMRLGIPEMLDEMTQFSWQNKGVGTQEQSGYGVWMFFEDGMNNVVAPRNDGGYFLSITPSFRARVYTKQYPTLGMYANFDSSIFWNAVNEIVHDVQY